MPADRPAPHTPSVTPEKFRDRWIGNFGITLDEWHDQGFCVLTDDPDCDHVGCLGYITASRTEGARLVALGTHTLLL